MVHHCGKDNDSADVLSRLNCGDKNDFSQRNPENLEQVHRVWTNKFNPREGGEVSERE